MARCSFTRPARSRMQKSPFDNLLERNRQLFEAGRAISADDYGLQAQKAAGPSRAADRGNQLNRRSIQIRLAREEDCWPNGLSVWLRQGSGLHVQFLDKNQEGSVSEDFKDKPDDEISALSTSYFTTSIFSCPWCTLSEKRQKISIAACASSMASGSTFSIPLATHWRYRPFAILWPDSLLLGKRHI
jgi:hypothetical protein